MPIAPIHPAVNSSQDGKVEEWFLGAFHAAADVQFAAGQDPDPLGLLQHLPPDSQDRLFEPVTTTNLRLIESQLGPGHAESSFEKFWQATYSVKQVEAGPSTRTAEPVREVEAGPSTKRADSV